MLWGILCENRPLLIHDIGELRMAYPQSAIGVPAFGIMGLRTDGAVPEV